MSDEQTARKLCDLLGWEYRERGEPGFLGYVPAPGDVCVWPRDDGRFDVNVWRRKNTADFGSPAHEHVIDLATLAIATLVRHAGPVDVGPCPECGGGAMQWAQHYRSTDLATGFAYRLAEAGWSVATYSDPGRARVVASRPCPACVVDGKPTGRRIVSAPEAALLAAPRAAVREFGADDQGRAFAGLQAEARRVRGTLSDVSVATNSGGWLARGTITDLGHEGAREALRALAEGWREHLPVLADHIQVSGQLTEVHDDDIRQWAAPRRGHCHLSDWLVDSALRWTLWDGGGVVPDLLAECPAVARWVLAWLAGACELACEPGPRGSRIVRKGRLRGECSTCAATGLALGLHLPTIYAHLTAAWERETVPCARDHLIVNGVYYDAHARWMPKPPAPPCSRCAGLGRFRPEDSESCTP